MFIQKNLKDILANIEENWSTISIYKFQKDIQEGFNWLTADSLLEEFSEDWLDLNMFDSKTVVENILLDDDTLENFEITYYKVPYVSIDYPSSVKKYIKPGDHIITLKSGEKFVIPDWLAHLMFESI